MPEHETGKPGTEKLEDLLTSLVEGLPAQQQRLDEDYLQRLAAIPPALRAVTEQGPSGLQRLLAPSHWVMHQTELDVNVRVTRSRQRELRISTNPLNLAFASKYAYSDFSKGQLRVVVDRVAIEPRHTAPRLNERGSKRGKT